MKRTINKTLTREIRSSMGRYIAILAIIALGVGFFSGLKICKIAMLDTGNEYIAGHKMFDFRLLSTMGITDGTVEKIGAMEGVGTARGAYTADVITESAGGGVVMKLHSITPDISELELKSGRMPENDGECVIDASMTKGFALGDVIVVSEDNSDATKALLKGCRSFNVVGTVFSPLYLNYERGTTSLGNGSVSAFVYVNESVFSSEYYHECYVALEKSAGYDIYSDGYKALADKYAELIEKEFSELEAQRYNDIVSEAGADIEAARKEYSDGMEKYGESSKSASEMIAKAEEELEKNEKALENGYAELDRAEAELIRQRGEIDVSLRQLEGVAGEEAAIRRAALENAAAQLEAGLSEINEKREALDRDFEKLTQGRIELEEMRESSAKRLADAKNELDKALAKIENAESELEKLEKPSVYVLGRDTNVGYVCFENDVEIVESISKVFPVFFFLIAALVCMTTMMRMVDEQRTQIGVLKALGYGNFSVVSKYIIYSGSAALIGCIAGYFIGTYLFPKVIWMTYDIMYGFAPINYVLDLKLALIALAVSLLCSVGATLASCAGEFTVMPAALIRPKAPKNGRRVLLERITFVWRRMKFSHKVSVRNVFRYKKRLFMMVLGISGCTALLLTGLGIRDSIQNVVSDQFDNITVYDLSVSFSKAQTADSRGSFYDNAPDGVENILFVHERGIEFAMNGSVKTAYLVVSETPEVGEFVKLHRDDEDIAYPKPGEAVVNSKFAEVFDIDVGDSITLNNDEMKPMTLTVSGIFDNYVYNYIYVLSESCEEAWGEAPEINRAYINLTAGGTESVNSHAVAAELMGLDGVSGVTVYSDLKDRMENTLSSLNYIVLLVIICAAALAFIVLYNLTNINICERIREIATLKVLGFYPRETSSYVFRENILLTVMGVICGLPLGKLLHFYVMKQINIDLVSFEVRIEPLSYILGIVLTFVFTAAVDLIMRGKLKKISMTESLKSVE